MLKSYKIQSITFLFLWPVSMILSANFILSVSMIGLLVLALFQLNFVKPRVQIEFRKTLKKNWEKFTTKKIWWVITIPFFIVAGFLEGFVTRHTEMPDWLALFIILTSFSAIVYYYVIYPIKLSKNQIVNGN